MNKSEYLKKLEAFKDFVFFPEDHHYEYKGKRIGISVTRFIEEFTQPFESEEIASKVAVKENKSIYEVLNAWEEKNQQSCLKGSVAHETAQSLWTGVGCKKVNEYLTEDTKNALYKIFKQEENFYNDYKDRFEHLADEFVIGSYEYDIASAIDHLFINKLTGGLVMVDYKTNTDIYKNEKYAKKMKVPLNHLKDTTLNHYTIQLSIYKFLLEKYTNIKLEEMFIVWFSEENDNYEILEVPYLKNEVEEILQNRRVKNMHGMGVLIMGASGSGKSTSLRNLPAEQTAIINITNKPMPFKNSDGKKIVTLTDYYREGEKEVAVEELYKRIIGNIKATDKKKLEVINNIRKF